MCAAGLSDLSNERVFVAACTHFRPAVLNERFVMILSGCAKYLYSSLCFAVDFLYIQDVTVHTTLFWVEVVEISLAVNNY